MYCIISRKYSCRKAYWRHERISGLRKSNSPFIGLILQYLP
jgi:hypothetical protein